MNQVFSTPIWHLRAEEKDKAILPEMQQWALKYKRENAGVIRSNDGGYHSDYSIDFGKLLHFENLQERLSWLPHFYYTSWWININQKGDLNGKHTHPGCVLSGIWYITDNYEELVFDHPLDHIRDDLNNMFPELYLQHSWDCKAGDIILFPSDIVHCVKRHQVRSPRISIAFNIIRHLQKRTGDGLTISK